MLHRSGLRLRNNGLLDRVIPDTVPPPTITSITFGASGPSGVPLVIRGTNFWYPDTTLHTYQVFRVTVDGVDATDIVVVSATELTCNGPAGMSPTAIVRLFSDGGDKPAIAALSGLQTEAGAFILSEEGGVLQPE